MSACSCYKLGGLRTISMPQVNCRPMREKVSKAMRTASLEPLMKGVPLHWEADGISRVCCTRKEGTTKPGRGKGQGMPTATNLHLLGQLLNLDVTIMAKIEVESTYRAHI